MDINKAIELIPDLRAVESDLQVIDIVLSYQADKTPIKQTLLEVKTAKKWTKASIEAACKAVIEVIGSVYDTRRSEFNDETESNIDDIALEPFTQRFNEEIKEQEKLKEAAKFVMEMASRVALALNITVPASNTSVPSKPKASFLKSLTSLIVEVKPGKTGGGSVSIPSAWLIEPVLREDAESVQMLALLDQKLAGGGVPAIQKFAEKMKLPVTDLAEDVLEALEQSRNQTTQSDGIIAQVTDRYNSEEKVVSTILEVKDGVNNVMGYLSGK